MPIPKVSLTFRTFSDSFALDNGVTPCAVATPPSKRFNSGSHPRVASSPSVSSLRGGKTRGKDEVGQVGGGP